jgi:carboxyl-terminal processing protease
MNLRPLLRPIGASLALILLSAGSAAAREDLPSLNCSRIPELSKTLLHKHISFHYVNDELRQRMIDTYVKRLDSSKSLFLQGEIAALKEKLKSVIQEIRQNDCSTLIEINRDLIKRYEGLEEFMSEFLSDPDYELDMETVLIIDPEKRAHPQNLEGRREFLKKLVHFQMSNYVSNEMELDEAKQKLIHRYELMKKRARERTPEDLYSSYLDAFATALDPHSNYLSREVLEDFQISMGLSLEGIGVALSSRDGYSIVEKIIPGGAAEGLGVLEPQDKIIAVAQDGEESVDIIDMDLRDVVRLIRGKRGTKVHLTILRQGDTSERFQVSIVRDKINLEEQAAKIRFEDIDIDGKVTKVGILELPSFYGGNKPGERQSSRDVEKLLLEAKKQKAEGLVLDLSQNGGGLLDTSVDIAGFFIQEGGVVAVRDTFSTVQVLHDPNSRITWSGPLVVMISRVSASASEIVAGALKDYRRAVIVGDDHTFGKGTVQSMVPLPEGLGALKVTTALFFRPGGKSTQNAGVASDVVVPSIFGTADFGEAHQTYSLPSQSIASFLDQDSLPKGDSSNDDAPWKPITPELIKELSLRSEKRVAADEDLQKVLERLTKSEERNGVIQIAELMKEKEEAEAEEAEKESAKKSEIPGDSESGQEDETAGTQDEGAEEDEAKTKLATHDSPDEEDEPSAQQLEAVRILADLIQLSS